MRAKLHDFRRLILVVVALTLAATVGLNSLPGNTVFAAYGQMEPRQVEMSSAVPAATGVSYQLTFTPVTTSQELIVDFCSDSPIIGTVATPSPCSFSAASTPVVTGGGSSAGTFTAVSAHTAQVTGLTMTAGSPFTVTLTGITNPTNNTIGTNMTFYARILTYPSTKSSEYTPASSSGGNTAIGADVTDAGGAALSTTETINLTTRIQEALTFCTSGPTVPGGFVNPMASASCTAATAPNLTIGHDNGSGTLILDSSAVDRIQAYTQLSSNATTGVIVRMKDLSSTTCGGMTDNGGTSCNVAAKGTNGVISANTSKVGMCVAPGSANTTPETAYTDTASGCAAAAVTSTVGMDETTAGNNVISTYGGAIFHTTGAIHQENDSLTFLAAAADTTPAGIYTLSESLIATGTF